MSLKDIGLFGNVVNGIKGIDNTLNIENQASAIGKLIDGFDNFDDINTIFKLSDVSDDLGEKALRYTHLSSSLGEVALGATDGAAAVTNLSKATSGLESSTKTVRTMGDAFVGVGTKIKTFFTSSLGITATVLAGIVAATAAVNHLSHSFTRAQEDFETKSSAYDETASEIESLNSKLDTTRTRISELQNLGQTRSLTIVEQSELDTLTQTNAQLDRQLEIQKSLLEVQTKSKVAAASVASKKEMSDIEYLEDSTDIPGWMLSLGKVIGTITNTPTPFTMPGFKEADTTTTGMLESSIKNAQKLQGDLSSLQERYLSELNANNDTAASKTKKKIDQTTKAYELATENIAQYTDTISGWIDASTNEYGDPLSGSEEQVRSWKQSLTDAQNMGKTYSQSLENSLKNYFDGSDKKYLIKQLKDLAASDSLTEDIVADMGMNLSDAGITAKQVADYFNQMADSASDAASKSKELGNSLTMTDIDEAAKSANAGDDYVKLADYLDKGKKLYDQGLTGTDDFKSLAEYLSYDKSNGNVDAFIGDYTRLQRYITKDSDGNLTPLGINSFLTDLQTVGEQTGDVWASFDQENQKWNINIDNTALAAKQLGISVQSMEAILGRIKDYDNPGDFNFTSAIADFNTAKESLEGLQQIYDKMDSGEKKDAFGKELAGWKSQLDGYENDLASLNPEFVVHMKLEYDLAQIQQKIDEMNQVIEEKGENNAGVDELAERNAAQSNWINTAKSQLGLSDKEGVVVPVEFSGIEDETNHIRDSLSNLSGEDLIKAQIQISNLQEEEQNVMEAFMNLNPDINLESDPAAITEAWNNFVNSDEFKVIVKYHPDTSELDGVAAKTQANHENTTTFIANTSELDEASVKLDEAATKANTPVETTITANVKNLDDVEAVKSALAEIPEDSNVELNVTCDNPALQDEVSAAAQSAFEGGVNVHANLNVDTVNQPSIDVDATAKVNNTDTSGAPKAEVDGTAKVNDTDTSSAPKAEVDGTANITNTDASGAPDVKVNGEIIANKTPEMVDDATGKANFQLGTSPTSVPDASGKANYSLGLFPTSLPPIYQTIIQSTKKAKVDGTFNGFDSGTVSNAYAYGTRHDISLNEDQSALINERGMESIVRNGKWMLIPGGAHVESLKKGDIIFNASQTADLVRSGRINGANQHGKVAYADGTAYNMINAYAGGASGGFSFSGGAAVYNVPNYAGSSAPVYQAEQVQEAVESVEESVEDALKKLTDYFDWIERSLKVFEKSTKLAEDAIEDAIGIANKESANSLAISKAKDEMTNARNAYDRYMSHANWFAGEAGLGELEQYKVQHGALDIEKYDEDTQTKINEYKDWYDKAQDCLDTIEELKDKEVELAQQRLEYIEDYYDAVIKINDAFIDANDAKLELNDAIGSSAVSDNVVKTLQESVNKQNATYSNAVKQLADYQAQFNELVKNGYIKEGSDAWYEGQEKIQDFSKQITEASTALIELKDKIQEVDYTKLQQVIDGFQRGSDRLKNGTDLKESRDEFVGRTDYQKQINTLDKSIKSNSSLRAKKVKEQNRYDVGSTRYQDLAEDISKIDDEIYGSLTDIEELRNKVFDAEFFNFDKDMDNLNGFMDEIKTFKGLLDEDAFYDKTGALTSEAYANIALTSKQIETGKQQIASYSEALKKLGEMYEKGLISETEYDDKQKELLNGISDSVVAVEGYKDELIDLYQTQMQKENDALKENIDLRVDALDKMDKYYTYANNVKSQTKDVKVLEAQIAALEGVSNASAAAELKRKKQELSDAQDTLKETKRTHENEMMSTGYSEMKENLDKTLEDTMYEITMNSDKQEEVISNMLNNVVNMYESAYGKINGIIANTGLVGSKDFNGTVSDIGNQSGVSSIVSGATQSQNTVKPGSSSTGINSNNTSNSNHSSIESNISKEPNTTNRLCAELTINKTSITLQEGNSDSITTAIRPNDAKNKSISWISSNSSVASVSGGTVTAIAPGTATITAGTTDGSNLRKTCSVKVTKKPDPPKPKPAPTQSTQGDGVPNIGDEVTYDWGVYHEDSYGGGAWGNWNLGGKMHITAINPNSPYPFHVSEGKTLGDRDRGWLGLNQLHGYNTGTRNAGKGLALFDETKDGNLDLNSEVLVTNRGVLKQMDGDTIFSKAQVQKLYDLSAGINMPNKALESLSAGLNNYAVEKKETNLKISIGNMIGNVEHVDKNTLPKLNDLMEQCYQYVIDKIMTELPKM